ncbi:hypothetical protein F53441_1533 [Fusarium austroafricanum]|uniref:Uncharacterized protein n=1 Tax=Fusarium austroafricanum TaxID=2364996 RepID=A0A8H4KVZ0_9HYPO|nr:hypothetical protein F53441_1533 [Fusarium austroafricanum]
MMSSGEDTLSSMSPDGEPFEAPQGYYVTNECPNEAEKYTYTCPYVDCDAQPTLDRHAHKSKHRIEWVCDDDECDMYEAGFENCASFLKHARESHEYREYDDDYDIVDTDDSAFTTSMGSRQPSSEDDVFGPASSNPWVYTDLHQLAAKLNRVLTGSLPPGPGLQAEQEAIRSLRCTSPRCPMHGEFFKTANSFYQHLKDEKHRNGWCVEFDDENLDYNSDQDILPGIQVYAGGRKGICINDKCPKYRMRFESYSTMKQHSRSFGHALTEEDLESTEAEGSDEDDEQNWQKSDMHGMEVVKDEGLWRCTKQGCKGYGKVITRLLNAKSHFSSDAHLTAAEELSSSDESLEQIEGMEYSKDEGVWICVKRCCKKYKRVILHLGNARKHALADCHALAEEFDPSSEPLEGMDYIKDKDVWICVKPGCKNINTVIQHLGNARKHVNADFHALAEEPSSPELGEDIEGMVYVKEERGWTCTKYGCKSAGKVFANIASARGHGRGGPHTKAGQISAFSATPTQSSMGSFMTPPQTLQNPFYTPMELDDSRIHVTPGSSSDDRRINLVRRPASAPRKSTFSRTPKTIRVRRSSATRSDVEKRQEALEKQNRELEDRVSALEWQMSQVLSLQSSPRVQHDSPIPQNSPVQEDLQSQYDPWAQESTQASQSSLPPILQTPKTSCTLGLQSSQTQYDPWTQVSLPPILQAPETPTPSAARVADLPKFVRASFRPSVFDNQNEEEL